MNEPDSGSDGPSASSTTPRPRAGGYVDGRQQVVVHGKNARSRRGLLVVFDNGPRRGSGTGRRDRLFLVMKIRDTPGLGWSGARASQAQQDGPCTPRRMAGGFRDKRALRGCHAEAVWLGARERGGGVTFSCARRDRLGARHWSDFFFPRRWAPMQAPSRTGVRHAQEAPAGSGQPIRTSFQSDEQKPDPSHDRAAGGPRGSSYTGLRLARGAGGQRAHASTSRAGGAPRQRGLVGSRARSPPGCTGGGRATWPGQRAGGADGPGGTPTHRGKARILLRAPSEIQGTSTIVAHGPLAVGPGLLHELLQELAAAARPAHRR